MEAVYSEEELPNSASATSFLERLKAIRRPYGGGPLSPQSHPSHEGGPLSPLSHPSEEDATNNDDLLEVTSRPSDEERSRRRTPTMLSSKSTSSPLSSQTQSTITTQSWKGGGLRISISQSNSGGGGGTTGTGGGIQSESIYSTSRRSSGGLGLSHSHSSQSTASTDTTQPTTTSPRNVNRKLVIRSGDSSSTVFSPAQLTSPGGSTFSPAQLTSPGGSTRGDEADDELTDLGTYEGTTTGDDDGTYDDTNGTPDDDDDDGTLDDDDDEALADGSTEGNLATPSTPSRSRVPGGAGAKLMLLGPHNSDEYHTLSETKTVPSEDTKAAEEAIQELQTVMQKAREEFEKGTERNRRYQPTLEMDEEKEETTTNKTSGQAPSFLNRNHVFHKSASGFITAVLTPRGSKGDAVPKTTAPAMLRGMGSGGDLSTVLSGHSTVFSGHSTVLSGHSTVRSADNASTCSAFQAPEAGQVVRDASYQSFGRHDVSKNLVSKETEQKLEEMTKEMHDPTKTLTDLLTAIATPEDSDAMDLGFMVRRKNACGAIKVLTNDIRKRVRICWTLGVLPALTSVLSDCMEMGLMKTFPDRRVRNEYEAARHRAISTLLNLSMPKQNRLPVLYSPGLMQAITYTIATDEGEARRGCTAVLAYLGKTPENRLLLAQLPGLLDIIAVVLRPLPPRLESPTSEKVSAMSASTSDSSTDSDSEKERVFSTDEESSLGSPKNLPPQSLRELTGYDETASADLRAARQNTFALLAHLVKEKDNAYHFVRHLNLYHTLIDISDYQDSPSHTLAVKIIANLTRHRLNTKLMVFQERYSVTAIVNAANSETEETRLYACYALQNLSQEKACRQELASVDGVVSTLCLRGRFALSECERQAAVSALKNLCDEPANLIPLTNTPECVATLMHLAHGKEEGVTELMQYLACDSLATLSHWLRKIATSGKALDAAQRGLPQDNGLFVPTLRVVTWEQWK